MIDPIFETYAPAYWRAALPAIPLRERDKRPAIGQWQAFGTRMPDTIEMNHWMHSFPEGNIGLPLGIASGMCMIDIDTEDEALIEAILDVLPKSPWKRVGKKGMALAYQFEGQKNFKLRGADGGMLLEFLGQGNQVVLPPSIHPDTQKPYTANCNLWDVKDQLPYLGEDIEDKLRALLGAKGFELGAGGRSSPLDVIPAGERDVQMVRHAGYLGRVVLGIDKNAQFSLWDAIMQMHTWVEQFTAKVSGDAMDPNKGVAKLLEFLKRDLDKGKSLPLNWDAGLPEEWREHPTVAELAARNGSKTWSIEQARAWFDRHGGAAKTADELVGALDTIIARLAEDSSFTGGRASAFFAHVHDRYGKELGLQLREMKSMLTGARKGLSASEAETHATIAQALLEELQRGGEIRYDQGCFWQWNGSCFAKLETNPLYRSVTDRVASPLSKRNGDFKAIVQTMEQLSTRPLVEVDVSGLNFANGLVASELALRPHDPVYGRTFTLPFEYDRSMAANCHRWLDFLHTCWGQEHDFEDRVLALQEMFGATLFGQAPAFQRAFVLYGKAETGKSQILRVLSALLPRAAIAALGPHEWDKRFALTELVGKTANIVGELPENGLITGNVFKEVIEGSSMSTEFKGKDRFVFQPTCAHWFASNYLPVSKDTTKGFLRRWLILDFNHRVPSERKIPNFAEILVAEERHAIAAWAVEGLPRLLQQSGYTLPHCHHLQVGKMKRLINSVHAFLEDTRGLAFGSGSMKCRTLYDKYIFHMRDVARGKAVSFEHFNQMLVDLDYEVSQDFLADHVVIGITEGAQLRAVG